MSTTFSTNGAGAPHATDRVGAIVGELARGRLHLLTGGAGSGKTTLALQFLADGLARGEQCAMLVAARGDDVKPLALSLGIRVDEALRVRRLHLFRWRPVAQRGLGHVTAVQAVVADLRELLRTARARRVVIDSFAPLLGDGLGGELLADTLDSLGATSLLTLAERVDDGYDRWLEPVVQRAAAVVQLRRRGAVMEFECLSRRGAPGLRDRGRFIVDPGRGLAAAPPVVRRRRTGAEAGDEPSAATSLLMLPTDVAVPRTPEVEA